MADSLEPIPMPSRRELFTGMTLLLLVGGFALSRGGESLKVTPEKNAQILVRTHGSPEVMQGQPTVLVNGSSALAPSMTQERVSIPSSFETDFKN